MARGKCHSTDGYKGNELSLRIVYWRGPDPLLSDRCHGPVCVSRAGREDPNRYNLGRLLSTKCKVQSRQENTVCTRPIKHNGKKTIANETFRISATTLHPNGQGGLSSQSGDACESVDGTTVTKVLCKRSTPRQPSSLSPVPPTGC